MAEPLVSVIMPAYNAGKFIHQSIGSVLSQTYANWELLVIDDGSIDETSKVLFSFNDERIKIFTQKNKGVSAARNVGLRNMQGKYFTFLDADDILPADSLQKRVKFCEENPSVDILGAGVAFCNKNGQQKIWKPDYKGNPLQNFIRIDERVFCSVALMIRYKSSVTYHFKEGVTHVEDLLFFSTIAAQEIHTYDYIDDLVYIYRISGNSAISNLRGLEEGYWSFYKEVKSFSNALPSSIRYLKWRIIRIMFLSFLAAGEVWNAIKVLSNSFRK